MSVLSTQQKKLFKNTLIKRREFLQDSCAGQSLIKEVKSPEVMGPDEISFEGLIAEVDNELINHHQAELQEIELALLRIKDGSYGVCIDCRVNIGYDRLKAYPMAKRCIDCKQNFEKQSA